MKIAITADCHLRKGHSERTSTLEEVFKETDKSGIEHLIIAGDLFDEDPELELRNQFKALVESFAGMQVHVIPGNHDPGLSPDFFALNNLKIYSGEAQRANIPSQIPFVMVPYNGGKSMADALADADLSDSAEGWVLIGHGDYQSGNWEPNPLESRHGNTVYMPLQRGDLIRYEPKRVFLGHIHKQTPVDSPVDGWVLYPGSPHGLDITETGRRRYLIYDLATNVVEERFIGVGAIYFDEPFMMVPADNELEILRQSMEDRKNGWNLTDEEMQRVNLRLRVNGFAQRGLPEIRESVESYWKIQLKSAQLVKLDTDSLHPGHKDPQRKKLTEAAFARIDGIPLDSDSSHPEHKDPQSKKLTETVRTKIDDIPTKEGVSDVWYPFGVGPEPTVDEIKNAAQKLIYQSK